MGRDDSKSDPQIDALIARWQGREGGQERANYALFLIKLCDVGSGPPGPGRNDAANALGGHDTRGAL